MGIISEEKDQVYESDQERSKRNSQNTDSGSGGLDSNY